MWSAFTGLGELQQQFICTVKFGSFKGQQLLSFFSRPVPLLKSRAISYITDSCRTLTALPFGLGSDKLHDGLWCQLGMNGTQFEPPNVSTESITVLPCSPATIQSPFPQFALFYCSLIRWGFFIVPTEMPCIITQILKTKNHPHNKSRLHNWAADMNNLGLSE